MPATSDSPMRNEVASREQRRRRERERVADVAEVADGGHPHEDEIVTLGDNELVHAVGSLGRDEEVEAELPPFGGDADGVLGRQGSDLVAGLPRTDVVRLVDDDEDRLALGSPPPQRREHGLRRDRLLGTGVERAEVDDERTWPARRHEILERSLVPDGPDRPPVEAEVSHPRREGAELRGVRCGKLLGEVARGREG